MAAGASLLSVLLAEGATRVVSLARGVDFRLYLKELTSSRRHPEGLFVPHPQLGYALRPGLQGLATTSEFSLIYTINDKGLRDRSYEYAKPPGTLRILVVGDSYTFGEGVPYGSRFTDLLEDGIYGLQVINAGVPGYSIEQEALYFLLEGIRYEPDILLVLLNTTDILRYSNLGLIQDGELRTPRGNTSGTTGGTTHYPRRDDPILHASPDGLLRHSFLLSYLSYQLKVLHLNAQLRNEDRRFWQEVIAREALPELLGSDLPAKQRGVRARTLALFEALNRLCTRHGIRLFLVRADHYGHHDDLIEAYGDLSYLGHLGPNSLFHDLERPLLRAKGTGSLTFTYDPHFTPQTHRIIADELIGLVGRHLTK